MLSGQHATDTLDLDLDLGRMFEDHLGEIALDWVREGQQATRLGAPPMRVDDERSEFLVDARMALIDLVRSARSENTTEIDLTDSALVAH